MYINSASRILSLVFLTLNINSHGWPGLAFLLIPLIALSLRYPKTAVQVFSLAKRLRWFYLSIIILYFWFFPGEALLPALRGFSPSVEGVDQALMRLISLLLIVSYSGYLIFLTSKDELISGIDYLLKPLKYLGINGQSYAVRLGLVLAIVPQISSYNSDKIKSYKSRGHKKMKFTNMIEATVDASAEMISSVMSNNSGVAGAALADHVTITTPSEITILDILVPLSLFIWLIW